MAHADVLPSAVIDSVAAQVAAEAAKTLGAHALQAKSLELTESFSTWALGADAVTKTGTDLTELTRQTGRWHHQIKIDGRAEAYARSMPLGPDAASWSLRELFASKLAGKIDAAIDWIDRNVQHDPLVRLLIVPAYQLHAFWLKQEGVSQVLVVDMPQRYARLQYETLYASNEFLDGLTHEDHVVGVSFK